MPTDGLVLLMPFKGWPDAALAFYEGLEADNSKAYWLDHKDVYDNDVKAPMEALLTNLAGEFGDWRLFRRAKSQEEIRGGCGTCRDMRPSGESVRKAQRGSGWCRPRLPGSRGASPRLAPRLSRSLPPRARYFTTRNERGGAAASAGAHGPFYERRFSRVKRGMLSWAR